MLLLIALVLMFVIRFSMNTITITSKRTKAQAL
jgi:hypothetical protein